MFDTTASEAVWNFPVWKADLHIEEVDTTEEEKKINVNIATLEELSAVENIDTALAEGIIKYREANGTIQELEELHQIEGYSENKHDSLLRTNIVEKTYFIDSIITLTTDSVENDHVDTDQNDPSSLHKYWNYTLTVSEDGTITGGSWVDDTMHPDFAWVPYTNPKSVSDSNSENPYLPYGQLLNHFGTDIDRN